MIVDIGGFYFQLIITTIYLLLYSITREMALLNIVYLSFVLYLFNMNPLINTDTYWFLADSLDHVNLNNEAMNELSGLLRKSRSRKLNIFLLSFGILKILFVSIVFMLIVYFLTNTAYLLFTGCYTFAFRTILKDCILTVCLIFFVK